MWWSPEEQFKGCNTQPPSRTVSLIFTSLPVSLTFSTQVRTGYHSGPRDILRRYQYHQYLPLNVLTTSLVLDDKIVGWLRFASMDFGSTEYISSITSGTPKTLSISHDPSNISKMTQNIFRTTSFYFQNTTSGTVPYVVTFALIISSTCPLRIAKNFTSAQKSVRSMEMEPRQFDQPGIDFPSYV